MFCLSGKGSTISCDVFPPFDISDGEYVVGLVGLATFNSIPNIETNVNDKVYIGDRPPVIIDEGSYEIEDIEKYIVARLPDGVRFQLKANNNTLKTEILCSETVDLSRDNTIGNIIGFSKRQLIAVKKHVSDLPVDILKVNSIRVDCNLVRGSFENGTESHIIHEFYPLVEPGFKIVETPGTIIYLPVNVHKVNNITVQLKDQDGRPINLRDETLSIRLHITKVNT